MINHDFIATVAQEASNHLMQESFGLANSTSHNGTSHTEQTTAGVIGTFLVGVAPAMTILGAVIGSHLVDYLFWELMFALAAVETPVPGGPMSEKYGILDSVEEEAISKRSDDHISHPRRSNFVTSSIRSTLRHLQTEAGDFSALRGIGTQWTLQFFYMLVYLAINFVLPTKLIKAPRVFSILSTVLTTLLFAQADTAWLHITISKPRLKFWFRRLPLTFLTMIKILWIPTIALILAQEFVNWAPSMLPSSKRPQGVPGQGQRGMILVTDGPVVSIGLFKFLWSLLASVLLSLVRPILKTIIAMPIEAVYRRMQASVLPDEDDPIVPIDRSFSGNSNSGILYQQKPFDFLSACRSIDRPTIVRLAVLYIKFHLIKEILGWVVKGLFITEAFIHFGASPMWVVLKGALDVPIVQQDMEGLSRNARDILSGLIANTTVAASNVTVVSSVIDAQIMRGQLPKLGNEQ
ncbi:hypothetical protein BDV97DRAFT_345399 [Delphinella strobiligena]|nr:hypothetical protein BDV97DRAFT_345399 [Delphinella strobiligena]